MNNSLDKEQDVPGVPGTLWKQILSQETVLGRKFTG